MAQKKVTPKTKTPQSTEAATKQQEQAKAPQVRASTIKTSKSDIDGGNVVLVGKDGIELTVSTAAAKTLLANGFYKEKK